MNISFQGLDDTTSYVDKYTDVDSQQTDLPLQFTWETGMKRSVDSFNQTCQL